MDAWDNLAKDFLTTEAPRLRASQNEGELVAAMIHTQTSIDGVLTGFIQDFQPAFNAAEVSFPDLVKTAQAYAPQVLTPDLVNGLVSYNRIRNKVAHERHIPERHEVLGFVAVVVIICEGLLKTPARGRLERLAAKPTSLAQEYAGGRTGFTGRTVAGVVYGAMISVVGASIALGVAGIFVGFMFGLEVQDDVLIGLVSGVFFGILAAIAFIAAFFGFAALPPLLVGIAGGMMGLVDGIIVGFTSELSETGQGTMGGLLCALSWVVIGYWSVRRYAPDWDFKQTLATAAGLAILNGIIGYFTAAVELD